MYMKVLSHTGCCEAYFCCFAGYCLLLSVLRCAILSFMCCVSSTTQISYLRTCPVMSVNCQCSASIAQVWRVLSDETARAEYDAARAEYIQSVFFFVLFLFCFVTMGASHRSSRVCIALEEMENHSGISL